MLKSRPFENDTTFKRNKEQITNSKEINTELKKMKKQLPFVKKLRNGF